MLDDLLAGACAAGVLILMFLPSALFDPPPLLPPGP